MILKNGKFYKDNVEVPIEIGNSEQIALLKKMQKSLEEGIELVVHIDEKTTYDLSCSFKCPLCNKVNEKEDGEYDFEPDDYEIEGFLESEVFRCRQCKQEYELIISATDYKNKYKLILPNENKED